MQDLLQIINRIIWGCLKSRNPLTAKVAEILRKERKEQVYSVLTLRTLRLLSVLCG